MNLVGAMPYLLRHRTRWPCRLSNALYTSGTLPARQHTLSAGHSLPLDDEEPAETPPGNVVEREVIPLPICRLSRNPMRREPLQCAPRAWPGRLQIPPSE